MNTEIGKPEIPEISDNGTQIIKAHVREAAKLGHLDFYYQKHIAGNILWLFSRERRSPGYFCHVLKKHQADTQTAFGLIVKDGQTKPQQLIAKLRIFINTHYPEASGLPIGIFDSITDYLNNNPTLRFVERFGIIDPKAS
ncbi:hypothetical protein A3A60_00830 [Candidatus Curtissbacteria bacterium RIFCSPLOWO2_01_FULL_42_26]|uniref:Uncharacterized protein n=1 Tax=Candidatus Curtissbacteria bacterium RIFCSPLOWO2_01_FULL_42_26 TaxID=1797729 RepID=A0A1F5HXH2_9BACT|nr:MAG: hypothetical protein A3A60_00830 [Candidatus Curtissbacteria bacterium RIFCSPLOWO2_01_FULL_42_26]